MKGVGTGWKIIRVKKPDRYNAALQRTVEWMSMKVVGSPKLVHHESLASEKKEEKKEVRLQEGRNQMSQ